MSDNCEKFQECYTDTSSWHSFHTHAHTHGHDRWQNDMSDNCEKFQRCYTDTGSWHSLSHTHTHTRTWQMTEWYIWQLWEISEMFHGYWLMVFFFTHTHADMTYDRTCLTIVRSFRSVTRILAHGISLSHKHGHDRWQNIYLTVVRSFRDVTRILAHGILFHTHTHTWTWLKTKWYIWQLWEVSEMLQWYTDTGSWHSSPRHTHTHTRTWLMPE